MPQGLVQTVRPGPGIGAIPLRKPPRLMMVATPSKPSRVSRRRPCVGLTVVIGKESPALHDLSAKDAEDLWNPVESVGCNSDQQCG